MRAIRTGLIAVLLALVLPAATPEGACASLRPTHAAHAIVSSVHELASQAGVEVLQQGGNAVDAAVAVGFALAVVHPQAGNLGGGGFMLVRLGTGEAAHAGAPVPQARVPQAGVAQLHFLDYREKAPAAAKADMYLDRQGNILANASLVGYRAIGVPGSVAGLAYAQKHWGRLPLGKVVAPAIRLAREGYRLAYEDAQELHDEKLAKFPESRRIFQRDGRYYQPGEIFRQPELARTLERIAQNPDEFYRGEMARQIAAAVQKGGGLLTAQDLAEYEVKEREPIHGTYRGLEIYSAPPPSSGGVALIEALNILEGYDLAKLGQGSAEAMHLTIEAFRRAFYDRAEFLGDPDFASIPVAELIDKKYALAWRASVNPDKASASAGLERPKFGELDRLAAAHARARVPHAGVPAVREPEQTTHYSVVDAEGNAVAVTTTLNMSYGAGVTVEGLGFLLNDEMDDFSSKPGVPNGFGLIQGPANAIGPGKRPLSAMTPTLVTREGKLWLVLGSPGGPTIITTVANVLMGVEDYGLDIQAAVNAPRFHHQWLPDATRIERGFSPDTLKLLERMGHKLQPARGYWGDAECIMIDPKTGERLGAPDGRNNGKAVGY